MPPSPLASGELFDEPASLQRDKYGQWKLHPSPLASGELFDDPASLTTR